jgi:carbon monoxide dehydrogenase subunit G
MKMTGDYELAAPRERVWRALNDPEVLRLCFPGVETLEQTSETGYTAKVRAKVGPVSARFTGAVTLSELDPPASYRLTGEGKGGAAGFARGSALVRLEDLGARTLLRYEVDAKVGGKLAQLGSRLVDGAAAKMAEDFFVRFAEAVGPESEDGATPMEEEAMADDKDEGKAAAITPQPVEIDDSDVGAGAELGVWVTALICAVLILLAIFAL